MLTPDNEPYLSYALMDIIAQVNSEQSYAQANQMMRNSGGHFTDVSTSLGSGLEIVQVSRATAIDIEIRWPDGVMQRLDDVPVDQLLRIEQTTSE